jgi:hypothetical protein
MLNDREGSPEPPSLAIRPSAGQVYLRGSRLVPTLIIAIPLMIFGLVVDAPPVIFLGVALVAPTTLWISYNNWLGDRIDRRERELGYTTLPRTRQRYTELWLLDARDGKVLKPPL